MPADTQGRPLYDFAYVHRIDERLAQLATLAEDEDWGYTATESDHAFPVLYYYFHYTFMRVQEQGKIVQTEDDSFACFNTGLVTDQRYAQKLWIEDLLKDVVYLPFE